MQRWLVLSVIIVLLPFFISQPILLQPSYAEFTEDSLTIEVSKSGMARIVEEITPRTTVSRISVKVVAANVSGILAVDESSLVLSSYYSNGVIKIDTLGSSHVTLTYNAEIVDRVASDIWSLSFTSEDIRSTVVLPPMSDIIYVNDIPIDINDNVITMPAGEISMRYKVRSVATNNFVASWDKTEYSVQIVTASRVEQFTFEQSSKSIILTLDKGSPLLVVIPKSLLGGPYLVRAFDDKPVDFRQYYQNSTHSWIRIDITNNNSVVRIVGSTVVPEFLPSPLPLAAGIAAGIILLLVLRRDRSRKLGRM